MDEDMKTMMALAADTPVKVINNEFIGVAGQHEKDPAVALSDLPVRKVRFLMYRCSVESSGRWPIKISQAANGDVDIVISNAIIKAR